MVLQHQLGAPVILWCAAMGKAAAFGSNYLFPKLIANGGVKAQFYYGGAIGFVAAGLLIITCPPMDQVSQQLEDKRFMEYLSKEGYDISSNTTFKTEIDDDSESESLKKNKITTEVIDVNDSLQRIIQ